MRSHSESNDTNTADSRPLTDTITMQLLYEEIINLKNVNSECLDAMKLLQEENKILKNKIIFLEKKMNWLEQNKKQNVIEITGVPNVNNNNALKFTQKIFCDGLKVNVESKTIDKCYVKKIINKSRNNNSIHDNSENVICVHFSSFEEKLNILKCKSAAKEKLNTSIFGENDSKRIYINHSFTKYTKALFMAAKKVKIEKHYKYLWFKNSNILMKKQENSRIMAIRSFDDLEKIQF